MKILIVDDSQFIRTQLSHMLKDDGHEVIEAKDGAFALKFFFEQRPDIVILDLLMPGLNGIDVLKQIKQTSKHTPVIICSSLGSRDETVREVVAAGASDVIVKPFQIEDLRRAIARTRA